MPECNGCEYAARIENLEKASDRNSEQHEKIYSRVTALETQSGATSTQFKQIMDALSEMKVEIKEVRNTPPKDVEDLKRDIKEIKDKPSKRWDTVVNSALQWLVVAILAAVVVLK